MIIYDGIALQWLSLIFNKSSHPFNTGVSPGTDASVYPFTVHAPLAWYLGFDIHCNNSVIIYDDIALYYLREKIQSQITTWNVRSNVIQCFDIFNVIIKNKKIVESLRIHYAKWNSVELYQITRGSAYETNNNYIIVLSNLKQTTILLLADKSCYIRINQL